MICLYASQLKFLRCLECMLLIYVEDNRFHVTSVLSPQRNKVLIYDLTIQCFKLRSGCKFTALFSESTPIKFGFEVPRCGEVPGFDKACNSGRFHYIVVVVLQGVFLACADRRCRSSYDVGIIIMLYYLFEFRPMGLVYNNECEFSEFGKVPALHRLNHRNEASAFCMCPGCFHACF